MKKGERRMDQWDDFLAPYEQVVSELKIKLRGIRKQFNRSKTEHSPIEFVTGRVKTKESILEKCEMRGVPEDRIAEEIQDIAGLRIMCQFTDDIYEVIQIIKQRRDMKVVKEVDYISNIKESGYRSYHLIVEYPVQFIYGEKIVYAEIQIRTLAMNFWATIEHSLNYKYRGEYPEEIRERLRRAAEAASMLDNEMSEIRDEIREAQQYFNNQRQERKDRK